ncbi:MAG: SufD family Fe-S cluster assembly protein [Bdellovibrionales bacterium]|nr:SufD family Fe-S cluster assembly protein [Bdellovibrionales bacterium]
MKEPTLFKEVIYPPSVLLAANVNALTEWTSLCAPAESEKTPSAGALEIIGKENTQSEYVVFQALPAGARAASLIKVRLEKHARVRLILIQDGAAASHLEVIGDCAGEGSEFEIRGLQNAKDTQRHSINVTVVHSKPNTRSDMKVWCVGRDQGHSIFKGMIDIKPGASQVEAYQKNKNLMLSDKAVMDAFPKLLIANDEVKAAHGASIATLEQDQLAYLQSRGISRVDAEAMVTRGFIHQIVDDIKDVELRAKIESKLGLQEFVEESLGWAVDERGRGV